MVDNLRFFAGAARTLEGKAAGEYLEGYTSFIRREPVGVVGQIAPWNYPLMMAIWKIGPALAAGNTIVLKPRRDDAADDAASSARSPRSSCPRACSTSSAARGETGQALVTHPDVDMVSLTGSVETGKWIARAAADTLKRVHLELGGKAPVVVFDDADMEAVARDDRRHRLLQRRPGLHGGDARARRSARSTTTSLQGLAEQAKGYKMGDTLRPGDDARPAELRSASASASRASSSASPATPRSSPAARSPTCPASSSSRPSSAACARTTR